jgi:hypothetical protein
VAAVAPLEHPERLMREIRQNECVCLAAFPDECWRLLAHDASRLLGHETLSQMKRRGRGRRHRLTDCSDSHGDRSKINLNPFNFPSINAEG